jgi:hypothetical protein
MKDRNTEIKQKIDDYKLMLSHIDEAEIMIINQIKVEKAEIREDSNIIIKRYKKASKDLENIQKQIHDLKIKSTRFKYRITEKKMRYEHLLEPNPQRWQKISEEIMVLGEQIVACEGNISALELQKLAAEQARSMAQASLEAYESGAYEKSVDEDPRMKDIKREKKRIKKFIKSKQAELKASSRKPKKRRS